MFRSVRPEGLTPGISLPCLSPGGGTDRSRPRLHPIQEFVMVKTLRRWRTAAFLATLACAAITGSSGIPVSADPTAMVLTGRGHTGYGPHAFVINGSSVTGLYPGAVRNVGLRLVNPYGFD